MQFEEARARLSRLPERLPAAPLELMPVLLPGADGHVPAAGWPAEPEREAAVLLLIHPDEAGQARIVLTERAAGGHRHAGQISFPGGAIEKGDGSVVAAALREAAEEVGLDAAAEGVHVAGVLPAVDVRVSSFLVHPVVATAAHWPRLVADGREVAAILHAPLRSFMPGAAIETVTGERDGLTLRYGAYRVNGHLVWGATAGILGRFGAFLANPAAR